MDQTIKHHQQMPQLDYESAAALIDSVGNLIRFFLLSSRHSLYLFLTNKMLVLAGLATSGFIQVIVRNAEVSVDFFAANFFSFTAMSVIGVVKHYILGQQSGPVFLYKTLVELGIWVAVVCMGFGGAIFCDVLNRTAGAFMKEPPISDSASNYFIYSAFSILFVYHFIRAGSMINEIAPELIPKKWMQFFKAFQSTGKITDIRDSDLEEK